jgi:hypothetical protein
LFYLDNGLVYIKSKNIKVFPSGRRKAELNNGESYIPFDPEARLNTEANHRKHSSLNGYKQSYLLDWNLEKSYVILALAGYLFKIELTDEYRDANSFGGALNDLLKPTEEDKALYVNICTVEVDFFSGSDELGAVTTEILRDLDLNGDPAPCLDSLTTNGVDGNADSYYFTGLAFSTAPIRKEQEAHRVEYLQLLDYTDNTWRIHESSRLPVIEHGDAEGSVKIPGDVTIEGNLDVLGEITTEAVKIKDGDNYLYATTLKVVTNAEVINQLQFWTKPKPKA